MISLITAFCVAFFVTLFAVALSVLLVVVPWMCEDIKIVLETELSTKGWILREKYMRLFKRVVIVTIALTLVVWSAGHIMDIHESIRWIK